MSTLATKYRPKIFQDVLGQDLTTIILENQLERGEHRSAYLFTGEAGTGKTTLARILASHIDAEVIEIDGASNNGVDNIREIKEHLNFKPISHANKVIIIDEVHMLSTGAFNALLKILEEPPAHVVFIFATTDPHKLPGTIISRVQRYDLQRIPINLIVQKLKDIARKEELLLSNEAAEYIAKQANGGLRAAITMLDTCVGYSDNIEITDVTRILKLPNHDIFFSLSAALVQKDYGRIVEIIEQLHEVGANLKEFIKQYTIFVVDIMKAAITGGLAVTVIPSVYEPRCFKMLEHVSHDVLCNWFTTLVKLSNDIKFESNPKSLIQGVLLCL